MFWRKKKKKGEVMTNANFISEEGETLEDAALRELEEETGLVLTPTEKKTSNILGLWESVYPPVLPMGLPKRHHIVVYLHIVLDRTSQDLQNNFKVRFVVLFQSMNSFSEYR